MPHWARDPAIGNRMINARAEGLATKPAFRAAFRERRCLIVADGFYEWAKVTGERRKQPYWIHRSDGRLLALAGLWERWSGGGKEMVSCTIVTTEPTDVVRPIHDRMPLVLSREERERWLDPDSDPGLLADITRRPAAPTARRSRRAPYPPPSTHPRWTDRSAWSRCGDRVAASLTARRVMPATLGHPALGCPVKPPAKLTVGCGLR